MQVNPFVSLMDERDRHTLLRHFRQIISLASLAYIFTTIQYLMHDHTDDIDPTSSLNSEDTDSTHYFESASSFTHNHPQTATTSTTESSEKASGRWSNNEISLLLDFVRENCVLTTARGVNLKKSDFNKACDTVKTKDAGQCHYKWGHLCSIYKAASLWDRKSSSGWHDEYGVNARTLGEKQVFEEWLKTPEHAPLKPFAMKTWPFYRKMEGFMPGMQPRGTHIFDPTSQSATQALDVINAEMDDAEDQVGPSLHSPNLNMPSALAAHALGTSPLITLDFGPLSSRDTFPVGPSSHLLGPQASTSLFGGTRPPSSSLLVSTLPSRPQQGDILMNSVNSLTSVSSSQHRKRKFDAMTDGLQPLSSKRSSKSRMDGLNPVIIFDTLNSTLNRLADVMEKSLDATVATTSFTLPQALSEDVLNYISAR